MAKVSCILRHRGVQLILASSWARPAIFVAGKDRGGIFLFLLFLHFHSGSSFFPVPLFHLLCYLFYLFSPFLWGTTQNDPQRLTPRGIKPQHNQSGCYRKVAVVVIEMIVHGRSTVLFRHCSFYTLPHDSGRVLWFHIVCPSICPSVHPFFVSR